MEKMDFKDGILIIDTETTGLTGYPLDRVLEIGIAELKDGIVSKVYSEIIRYPDIVEFDKSYINPNGTKGIWIYRNSDLRIQDTLEAEKDVETVAEEVRRLVAGREVTAYNVPYDFGKFLDYEPWSLKGTCPIPFDIMDLATDRVYDLAYSDSIKDKVLQRMILDECRGNPDKWIRSEDAYRVLCPDDPGRLGMRQRHRAMDDAVREGWIYPQPRHLFTSLFLPEIIQGCKLGLTQLKASRRSRLQTKQ